MSTYVPVGPSGPSRARPFGCSRRPRSAAPAFTARDGLWTIAGQTGDPPRVLRNLLERDRMFIDRLAVQTRRLGLPGLRVDGSMPEEELAERVWRGFA